VGLSGRRVSQYFLWRSHDMKNIVLFEANEIPPRLIDDYVARRPRSSLAKLVRTSQTYVTRCDDEIELDPWISWPTLHRGVIDKDHRILHLGQTLEWADRTYPPIWRLLKAAHVEVGVFGSLHSSAVPSDAKQYCFYVPDYFATDAFAHPESLLPFQEFNLAMTRRSGRNVDTGIPAQAAKDFAVSAFQNGISLGTLWRLISQLAGERITAHRKIRRRNLQPIIGLDFFQSLLNRTRPQFATFYTNHVAAAMHRYWAAHFVDDYAPENPMSKEWQKKYGEEVLQAMTVFDRMVGGLMSHVERTDESILVIATSLGQAAVKGGETRGFTTVTDIGRFMDFMGMERADWSIGNAMVPCISVTLKPEKAEKLVELMKTVELMGVRAVRSERETGPLSFDLRDGKSFHLYCYWEGVEPTGKLTRGDLSAEPKEAGIGFFFHEDNVAVTAHHVPEGFMAVYDPRSSVATPLVRKNISTRMLAPAILRAFGIKAPAYMIQDAGLAL
jgi:hypothetical protein